MVVTTIQTQIDAYKQWLGSIRHHPRTYWWETQQVFQAHWDPLAADPVAMMDRCLDNSESRRLWQTDHWRPKEVIQLFWKFDPMTLRAMFDDLFNETRDVEARISRFQFGMDAILQDFRRAHPTSIENNHYHDDYRAIALYLAFRYPDQYAAPYDFTMWVESLVRLGARDIPKENDLGRFFKMHRTLMIFLDKDPAVATLFNKHLHPTRHFGGRSLLMATDFTHFVAERSR